jgi:hypothetical protein
MKILLLVSLIVVSFSACSKEDEKTVTKEKVVDGKIVTKSAPCDSKEDILKKLDEEKKKKTETGAPKAFSLQGGNTGCSVK